MQQTTASQEERQDEWAKDRKTDLLRIFSELQLSVLKIGPII